MLRDFLICALISASLPLITNASIDCYINANNRTIDQCQYCGFTNVTKETSLGTNFDIEYYCLHEVEVKADGIECSTKNKCQKKNRTSNGWRTEVSLYICEKDLCNFKCNANQYGLGLAVLLSSMVAVVLQK